MKALKALEQEINILSIENVELKKEVKRLQKQYNLMVDKCNQMSNDLLEHQIAMRNIKKHII
jgi:uncharacterized coiled-coil protein SlyX